MTPDMEPLSPRNALRAAEELRQLYAEPSATADRLCRLTLTLPIPPYLIGWFTTEILKGRISSVEGLLWVLEQTRREIMNAQAMLSEGC